MQAGLLTHCSQSYQVHEEKKTLKNCLKYVQICLRTSIHEMQKKGVSNGCCFCCFSFLASYQNTCIADEYSLSHYFLQLNCCLIFSCEECAKEGLVRMIPENVSWYKKTHQQMLFYRKNPFKYNKTKISLKGLSSKHKIFQRMPFIMHWFHSDDKSSSSINVFQHQLQDVKSCTLLMENSIVCQSSQDKAEHS